MQELEPSWERSTAIWWLLLWRGAVGGMLLGMVVGFIEGFIGAMLHASPTVISSVASLTGAAVGIVWSLFVVRMALRKKYRDFRIALVPVG